MPTPGCIASVIRYTPTAYRVCISAMLRSLWSVLVRWCQRGSPRS
jgi:hypothetical protein